MQEDLHWTIPRIDKLLNAAKLRSISADNHQDIERLYTDLTLGRVPDKILYPTLLIFGVAKFKEAESIVLSFLDNDNSELRKIAVHVIAFHWRMKSHADKVIDMLLHDQDEAVRAWAATGLGVAFKSTRDKKLLSILRNVVLHDTEPWVYLNAYQAMLAIIGYDGREISLIMRNIKERHQLALSLFE